MTWDGKYHGAVSGGRRYARKGYPEEEDPLAGMLAGVLRRKRLKRVSKRPRGMEREWPLIDSMIWDEMVGRPDILNGDLSVRALTHAERHDSKRRRGALVLELVRT